jgi:hypothetical protein
VQLLPRASYTSLGDLLTFQTIRLIFSLSIWVIQYSTIPDHVGTKKWTQITQPGSPSERSGQLSFALEDKYIYIYGGFFGKGGYDTVIDMHKFDIGIVWRKYHNTIKRKEPMVRSRMQGYLAFCCSSSEWSGR